MSSKLDPKRYLSEDEESDIVRQFNGPAFKIDHQVLWSGLMRDQAQKWADKYGMQTLTTAMGSLMRHEHPACLRSKKSAQAWSSYIRGASILFARRIAKSQRVIVLCAPPPEKLHPSGLTNYQTLEEPIIKGLFGGEAVKKIFMCHPMISGADEYCYEVWPEDKTWEWLDRYKAISFQQNWRTIRIKPLIAVQHVDDKLTVRSLLIDGEGDEKRKKISVAPVQKLSEKNKKAKRKTEKTSKNEKNILKKKSNVKKREKETVLRSLEAKEATQAQLPATTVEVETMKNNKDTMKLMLKNHQDIREEKVNKKKKKKKTRKKKKKKAKIERENNR